MSNCIPPGEFFKRTGKTLQAWGELVERIVQSDYCKELKKSGIGECELFIPPSLGGQRSEFFDEDAGVSRCDLLASYLKFHNSKVNEQRIADECKATNPKLLQVKVPDIISTRFARSEFYEIKPNSPTGIQEGREKIAWFNVLCSPTVLSLPYKAGTQYKPNFSTKLGQGNTLGAAFDVSIHIFWAIDGLILHEMCIEPRKKSQGDKCAALFRGVGLAAIVRLRNSPETALSILEELIPFAESPLMSTVGRASDDDSPQNDPADVQYVQLLLNDWRGRSDLTLIEEDGIYSDVTHDALAAFQESEIGIIDEIIQPGSSVIRLLEEGHLRSVFAAGLDAQDDDYPLPFVEELVISHDIDENPEDSDEQITSDSLLLDMQEEISDYLQLLYSDSATV